MNSKLIIILLCVILTGGVFIWWTQNNASPTPNEEVVLPVATSTQENTGSKNTFPLGIIAENLEIPWDIAFLPEGALLITERPGNLLYLSPDGTRKDIPIPHVIHRGEGGLLGVVLHPDFKKNHLLYLYMSVVKNVLGTQNAVIRYRFTNNTLSDELVLFDDIPGAIYHDGGRMEFGPDGLLYITTGDATSPNIAQDKNSLGGKILRVRDDGSLPNDNPFGTALYSYGHRNPQGLAWDASGNLWETEHGRSGVQSGLDEVNLIIAGKNYGWPTIEGDAKKEGMEPPAKHSGADTTWAPASALYWDGSIFFGGLRGEALYEAVLSGTRVQEVKTHLKGVYGRVRTVRLGPDGMFYITTSNTDGRGEKKSGDDKIIRIDPQMFR